MGRSIGVPTGLIVAALRSFGVTTYFGIPGGQNLPLYKAIEAEPDLIIITARHEQGAAFMADGMYRATGRVAAVLLIPGPGITNALAGLASAAGDSVGMVVLAPWSSHPSGAWAIHELRDQQRVLEGSLDDVLQVNSAQELPVALKELGRRLRTGPPRPICLHFPTWLLEQCEELILDLADVAPPPAEPDAGALDRAAGLLRGARRPLLFAGWGAICAGAEPELRKLASRLGAATVTSTKAKGTIPPGWPGHLGCAWGAATREALQAYDPDLTLAVGTRFSMRTLAAGKAHLGGALIHIDVDPRVPGRNVPSLLNVVGDAKVCLSHLIQKVGRAAGQEGARGGEALLAVSGSTLVDQILGELGAAFESEGVLVMDNCMIGLWAAKVMAVPAPRRWLFPMQFCPLGYALPAAIGASVLKPGKVTAVLGDGGMLFTISELAEAVERRMSLPVVVLNDSGYGSILANEEYRFGTRTVGRWRSGPDFVDLARGFGARGRRLDHVGQLGSAITEARSADRPTVIELRYKETVPWPA